MSHEELERFTCRLGIVPGVRCISSSSQGKEEKIFAKVPNAKEVAKVVAKRLRDETVLPARFMGENGVICIKVGSPTKNEQTLDALRDALLNHT
jgi:histidinol-phosphate/aromatic aminotransferase/cobyric acid decarboxylase-like protein